MEIKNWASIQSALSQMLIQTMSPVLGDSTAEHILDWHFTVGTLRLACFTTEIIHKAFFGK